MTPIHKTIAVVFSCGAVPSGSIRVRPLIRYCEVNAMGQLPATIVNPRATKWFPDFHTFEKNRIHPPTPEPVGVVISPPEHNPQVSWRGTSYLMATLLRSESTTSRMRVASGLDPGDQGETWEIFGDQISWACIKLSEFEYVMYINANIYVYTSYVSIFLPLLHTRDRQTSKWTSR